MLVCMAVKPWVSQARVVALAAYLGRDDQREYKPVSLGGGCCQHRG